MHKVVLHGLAAVLLLLAAPGRALWHICMLGSHHIVNPATALAAVTCLKCPSAHWQPDFTNVAWPILSGYILLCKPQYQRRSVTALGLPGLNLKCWPDESPGCISQLDILPQLQRVMLACYLQTTEWSCQPLATSPSLHFM